MDYYKKILKKMINKNITISVAESCTGGQLSSMITNVSGVSRIFHMGLTLYSNTAKSEILGIPLSTINKYGAVSRNIAKLMVNKLSMVLLAFIALLLCSVSSNVSNI